MHMAGHDRRRPALREHIDAETPHIRLVVNKINIKMFKKLFAALLAA